MRGPDRLAVVVPMFNEEAGAATTLASLFAQSEAPDEIAISINGGEDATGEVVRAALARAGYELVHQTPLTEPGVSLERWQSGSGPNVTVVDRAWPTSKADSVNWLVASGLLTAERWLIVDGDTVLAAGFVAAIKDSLYTLRRVRGGRAVAGSYRLEDAAMQSGAVLSLGASRRPWARLVALARSAEYAFAALLRTGQSRRVGGSVFGRSRLFTAVGCGFVARTNCFPMPADTLTEDHDFTLQVQAQPEVEDAHDARDLDALGFTVRTAGGSWPLSAAIGAAAEVVWLRSSNAVLVPRAQMLTEDPPNLVAYLKQVERWSTGSLEAASKRLLRPSFMRAPANVRFTYLSAQIENFVGLMLLLAIPVLLGLHSFVPSVGLSTRGLALWTLADLVATSAMVAVGFFKLGRASGHGRLRSLFAAIRPTLVGALPLVLLRVLNSLAYVTALTRVLPAHIARRGASRQASGERLAAERVSITWERPGLVNGKRVPARSAGLAASLLLWGVLAFSGTALLGSFARPGYRTTWELIYVSDPLDQYEHLGLPMSASDEDDAELPYCSPATVVMAAPVERTLEGDAADYRPLSPWGLLMLGRLAPLLGPLESAATSYDISPALLLKVLVNESFLDPLAVGPTEDIGLAQMTTDALTLLRSISDDPRSRYHNPGLFAHDFSLFDPLFSLCGGAAKLAWATDQPGGADERLAYARYINPLDGVANGSVSPRSRESVEAMIGLGPLANLLGATVAAYRQDPGSVSEAERLMLDLSRAVGAGDIGMREAYEGAAELVARFEVDDRAFYSEVLARLYPLEGPAEPILASAQ